MTDKLPQFVDEWIAEHELFGCIDAGLVRDFLAKFVLCEKASAVTVVLPEPDADEMLEPDLDVSMSGLEKLQQERQLLNAEYRIPLHAPATEVPK